MHKKRQQKIKRYRRSFNNQAERSLLIRRVLSFIAGLAVLFFVGWLVAGPAIDFISGVWYSVKNGWASKPQQSQSQSVSSPQSQSAPDSQPKEPEPPLEPVTPTATGNWAFVSLSALANEEIADETAKSLAAQGISSAVVTLKDDRGYIYYKSAIPQAVNSIAENTFDAKAVAQILTQNGITPIAYVSAFKDSIAPKFNRDMAVIYQGQENYLWLDNKAELGGSPWLSPNLQPAVDYTTGILNEALDMGYKNIIISNVTYPDVLGIESASFTRAEDAREKQQVLTDCVTAWQTAAKEKQGALWFEYPLEAALDDANKKTYGNLFNMGMENVLLDYGNSVVKTETGATIDAALHDAVIARSSVHSINLGIRISGGTVSNEEIYNLTAGAKLQGFQCFVVQ